MPGSLKESMDQNAYSRSSLTGEVFLLANLNSDFVIENVIFTSCKILTISLSFLFMTIHRKQGRVV